MQKPMQKPTQNQPGLVNISLSNSIESVFNAALRLDDEQGRAFKGLEDKVIQLTLAPVSTPLFFLFTEQQVSVQNQLNGEPDATMTSTLLEFMSIPLTRAFTPHLMSGDVELAQQFIDGLCSLEIDWEEQLSHYTGDLVAFKIGHGIRTLFEQKKSAQQNLGDTVKEYLQFEINSLPTHSHVHHFTDQVQQTQQKVEQLTERIERLQTLTSASS